MGDYPRQYLENTDNSVTTCRVQHQHFLSRFVGAKYMCFIQAPAKSSSVLYRPGSAHGASVAETGLQAQAALGALRLTTLARRDTAATAVLCIC